MRTLKIAALAAATALIMAIPAAPAPAAQDVAEFSLGSSNSQAGAHPDLTARVRLDKSGEPEVAKTLTINLPEGVFGNPGAIFRCRAAIFVLNQCQPGAQVGLITIVANYKTPNVVLGTAPIYNVETTSEDEAARLAFVVPTVNVPVVIPIEVRSESDYGLRMVINSISQTIALTSAQMTIWGFPAAESHDPQRFTGGEPGSPPGCVGALVVDCLEAPFPRSGLVSRPFTDNPSTCEGELPVTVDVTTYQDPVPSRAESTYPATSGCENQRFDPVFKVGLTTTEADAPSGLDVTLKADQFLEGEAASPSTLRSAHVTLPEGLSINPDAADGQTACSDADASFGTRDPGNCPDSSKIGTLEVITPALEDPLDGSLYIGEPKPDNQYRVFMIFDGQGIHAKLAAEIHPDPQTGRVSMVLENIPQVPFEEFNLHLFASDRGLMATPTHCTIYSADATLTPWNGTLSSQQASPSVSITSGPHEQPCPGQVRPFNPRLLAGTSNALSGDFSDFTLKLDRDDGDQYLGDLGFELPPGFTGSLRGIDYCSEAAIQAAAVNAGRTEQISPSCPAASQIGTTNVAAGPGSHPFNAVGKMYLTGPLKGAPISLAAVTPALAGPYDYGVVVVRVALHVDQQDAHVTAASDRVPSIIGGIPIRMRSIRVNIDRPRFTINPTNCSRFTVDSKGIGDQGTVTDFSSFFQVVNCSRMDFKPKMTVRHVGARRTTRRATNPALRFDLRTRPGDANIKSMAVTLPAAFNIDQSNLGNICSEKELTANRCAGRTAIGTASTTTPLLDQPLSGPVFAVSGSGGLPRLAFVLDGQVDLIPRAESKSTKAGLKTTVPVVPDAPIGHFRFNLAGGKNGYLSNTRSLCGKPPVVRVEFTGQNGKTRTEGARVKVPCGKQSKKRK